MTATIRALLAVVLAIAVLPAAGLPADPVGVGSLRLIAPWTRATPPAATNGAAFVEIRNTGAESDWLIAASSPAAGMTSIHETTMTDGVMKMRPAGKIEIPAGGSVLLKPGSLHIMLMKLKFPLQEGATVSVSLTFEKAGRVELAIPVAKPGAKAAPHGH